MNVEKCKSCAWMLPTFTTDRKRKLGRFYCRLWGDYPETTTFRTWECRDYWERKERREKESCSTTD